MACDLNFIVKVEGLFMVSKVQKW